MPITVFMDGTMTAAADENVESRSGGGQKIFGIGFHKTGTTSLGLALEQMGFNVCQGARPLRALFGQRRLMGMLETRQLDLIRQVATSYDAFRDTPWFMLYEELDRWFPGSKFILTTRDEGTWLESAVRYFGTTESDFRRWIYGAPSPVGHEDTYLERFRRHEASVRAYFSARPADLLILDWERGSGWRDLAHFLGRPHPDAPFPWARPVRGVSAIDASNGSRRRPQEPA